MAISPARSWRAAILPLLLLSLLLLALVIFPLWKPLVLAAVVAGALGRLQERLSARLGGRRRLAASALLVGLLLLVLIPLAVLTTYLVGQAIELAQAAHQLFATRGTEGFIALAPDRFEPFLRERLAGLSRSIGTLGSDLASGGLAAASAVAKALSSTGEMVFQVAMMLVALFFLLVDGPALMRWMKDVSPVGPGLTGEIVDEVRRAATSVLSSTVATAAAQSLLATIGYVIARVPAPLVFGFITFLAAFIPSVGTAVVAIPICLVLLLSGHVAAGVFLLAWSVLVAGSVDNVLKPLLARGGMRLHGAVVFFAMIGGVIVFGGIGLIVGPVAATLFLALVRIARREAEEARARSQEPRPLPVPGGLEAGEPARPH